jgi:hypothetical protein
MTKDEATAKLLSLKAACFLACDKPVAALAAVSETALRKARVAHHVQQHGKDSVTAAIAAGPLRFLDQEHIAEVGRVVKAGGDPVKAAGADPKHVALLETARQAHADHADELAAAYADFAAAG